MKKILFSMLTLFLGLTVLGCVNVGSTESTTTTTVPLNNELPDEEVEITFWHIYGQGKSTLLDAMIDEFEAMYPNVTINSVSQSDYNTLREKINMGISVGQVPTMALGYPDHFAGYVKAGAALSLDQFINSDVEYEITDPTSSIFGETVSVGLDIDDFVPAYLAENNQYQGGYYYSLPYSKSTETVAVNRSVLKAHVAEIKAAGIEIDDNGFLSHETPLTYTQLAALRNIIVDTNGTNKDTMKCEYLISFDSSANLFINMSRQWNAPYTNTAGQILINNDTTKSMLNYIDSLYQNNTLVLPIAWDQTFGSDNFMYGDVCMSVGSTAGVAYNVPSLNPTKAEGFKLGEFDVDFIQIPQFVAEDGDSFAIGDASYTGSLSAVQQGPNIGIFSGASTSEKLYAWLFIKFLTNTENTAAFSMSTGYLPVRLSSYESETLIDLTKTFSTTYADFLNIASDYWAAKGNVDWADTDERWDYLYSSMVVNIARNQVEYYQYDPAFAATSNSAGSATAREEAGYCLENIYNDKYTPEGSLSFMLSQLVW